MKALRGSLVVLFFGLLVAAPALLFADTEWRSPLTLSEPTEIPGQVLAPGKYVVKVLDIKNPRKVVQFMNENETTVIATVMAVPNYRVTTTGEGQFIYFQRAEGLPQAIKAWFYPANNFGIEFIYPKAEAVKLAETRKEEVYSAPSVIPKPEETVVAVTPEMKEVPIKEETLVAEKAPSTLPKTGSDDPLLLLAGVAALGAGVALRFARRG